MSEKPPARIWVAMDHFGPIITDDSMIAGAFPGYHTLFISAAAIRELEEKLHHRIYSLKMLGVTDTRHLEWCAMELGELLEGGK